MVPFGAMLTRDGDTWRWSAIEEDYVLMRGSHANARGPRTPAPFVAFAALTRGLGGASSDALRTMLEDLGVVAPSVQVVHRGAAALTELRDHLERALERGQVVAVRVARPLAVWSTSAAEADAPPPATRTSAPDEHTWVAIELVDDDVPPRPVPYARYRLTLPDGSTREGSLDAMGLARVTGIDPGTCQVTFPEYDAREWKVA